MAEIFSSFSGHWSPVADARRLKAGKILDIMFDGVPIVFFRDEKQKLRALINRCPHRSVKLSLGKLHKDGTIQCSFHGFRFDGSGACRHIPLNPEANPAVVRAQALLCEEKEGLLWIYSGDSEKASVPPLRLPAPLNEGEWYGSIVESEWPVHWSRSVQTALDVAHIPFTHPKSIGVAFGRVLGQEPNARLQFKAQHESDGGFHMDWWIDSADGADASQAAKDGGWVAFHPPNGMSLGIPQKNHVTPLAALHLGGAY